ncbi:MAG TPA: acetyl-CoA hydrolase/transferase C-terminal domain-containing protein [Candidatus Binataceae bacterium]
MATAPRLNGAGWRAQLGSKLVRPDEALSKLRTDDRVAISIAQATPFTLCAALAGRLMELENVVVSHGAAFFNWDLPGLGERFRLESFFVGPFDRPLHARGAAETVPIMYYRAGTLPPGLDNFNVYLMTVSPPDADGYVNFGDLQIMSKLLARNANLVIAEIDENFVRIGGDNSIHISEIDYFVERAIPFPEVPIPPISEEEQRIVSTICAMVAKELIPDRATIQIGVGSTSGLLAYHLLDHHELGMQTEIIPWGTTHLVKAGVLTGKHKKVFPGLVVGSGFAVLTPREELDFANGHPLFHLYDFNFTDDIRLIAREEGLIAVNNAMVVDLTGQANSETIGATAYTGTGGQTAFVVGTCLGGGKTVVVLPSTSMVKGRRVSRIVASMLPASIVTAPRAFVHHVVTEYGIANLKGKSVRDRTRELIAIAHPDFRSELTAEAKRLYG